MEKNIVFFQKSYDKLCEKYKSKKDKNKLNILFYVLSDYVFNEESMVTKKELYTNLGISEAAIRVILNDFVQKGYIIQEKEGKVFVYQINFDNEEIKELLNE